VRRLHRLLNHAQQLPRQPAQVGLVAAGLGKACPERSRRGRQHLLRVVLAAVEAPVDDVLDAPAQGREQAGDRQGGDDDGQLGLLAGEGAEDTLEQDDTAEVDQRPCEQLRDRYEKRYEELGWMDFLLS
jgi:hypothetical protein